MAVEQVSINHAFAEFQLVAEKKDQPSYPIAPHSIESVDLLYIMSAEQIQRSAIRCRAGIILAMIVVAIACALSTNSSLAPIVNGGHIWSALTLDIVLAIPLSFYFLIVRPLRWPPVVVVPLVALGFFAAGRIIPAEHGHALALLKPLAVVGEVGLLSWLILKARLGLKLFKSMDGDPIASFESAGEDIVHSKRAARILASEVAVFYYGLSLRPRQHIPNGFQPIAAHVKSGHGGLAFATVAILSIEGAVMHLYISSWSVWAAWILTLLTAYSALWVIADFRASKLRPTLLGTNSVVFRAGLRWEVEVPRNLIQSSSEKSTVASHERLNLTFLGEPSIWIHLSEFVDVRGPYGMQRRVRAIGLEPDERINL